MDIPTDMSLQKLKRNYQKIPHSTSQYFWKREEGEDISLLLKIEKPSPI